MKISVIQFDSDERVDENILKAQKGLEAAAQKGSQLAVLPEMWPLLVPDSEIDLKKNFAKNRSTELLEKMSAWSKEYGLVLVGGSIFEPDPASNKVFNRCTVFDSGQKICQYDKVHLFDNDLPDKKMCLESSSVTAGEELSSFPLAPFQAGLAICYDLRFPEHFRAMSQAGVNLFILPSAFTYATGKEHWEALLRARAIENLSYVITANQSGQQKNGLHCYGHSMIIDPWGKIVQECKDITGVLHAEIYFESIQNCRNRLPALEHRKNLSV